MNNTKQVFIINGSGGVGKDAFVESMFKHKYTKVTSADNKSDVFIKTLEIENYSSVDKVKEIAKIIGWDGAKTERDRKFLSDLKLLTTEYNDMPLNDMKNFTRNFMEDCFYESNADRILFLHIREPEEIEKAVKAFEKYDAKTVLIKKDSVKHITSNMADKNVYNYNYDIVVNNNGTLEELEEVAKRFLNDCLNGVLKGEY